MHAPSSAGPLASTSDSAVSDLLPTWRERGPERDTFRVGVPNTGRLFELAGRLLSMVLPFTWNGRGLLFRAGEGVEVLRARSNDLPHLLAHGVVDVAVTGSDYAFESGEALVELGDLELISGRLCLLTPTGEMPRGEPGARFRISTQYPRYATEWIEREGLAARVAVVTGAGELYPQIGLAEASLDMVVTGETRRQNGLRIAAEVAGVHTGIYRPAALVGARRDAAERMGESLLGARRSPAGAAELAAAGWRG